MLAGFRAKVSSRVAWLNVVLRDGDELPGHPAFKGYRSGSSLSGGRLVLAGFLSLGVLGNLASTIFIYFLENGELPAYITGEGAFASVNFARIAFVVSLLVSAISVYLLLSQWRKHARVIRSISNLCYECSRLMNRDKPPTVREALDTFAGHAVSVFQCEMPKAGIGCAVRYRTEDGFETFARKGALNPRRSESTVVLDPKGRMVGMLDDLRYANYSAFVCNDTQKAREEENLDSDDNGRDPEMGKDDSSIIASRLISYDQGEGKIIGVFYITSRKKGVFHANNIDIYLFLHDYVNLMLLNVLDKQRAA